MTIDPTTPIRLELTIDPDQSALLTGLDEWLRLGLLSPDQVRQISQRYLVCPLPTQPTPIPSPTPSPDFIVEEPPPRRTGRPTPARSPRPSPQRNPAASGWWPSRFQSLMAEISVIWLLFLGVFMVVVSSGVLAASQWQYFSPVGQYLVLWGYTLAFWVASLWTARKPALRLTSTMVQAATLLIIPINFWMLDQLALWRHLRGGAITLIASLSLTAILIQLLKPHLRQHPQPRLTLLNSIALSWLHWGWGWTGVPLLATYLGTLGTASRLVIQHRHPQESLGDPNPQADRSASLEFPLPAITLAIATLLLMTRAVFMAAVPPAHLGLAIGIWGGVMTWLARQYPTRASWGSVGWGLLLLGWLMTVRNEYPWQVIAISALAAGLLLDRVNRWHQRQDLSLLFLVGLQGYGLLWRVVPMTLRQQVLDICTASLGWTAMPMALIGIALLPYGWLALAMTYRFRRRQQPVLASHGEILVLILGLGLTCISLANPGVRSLNLLLSTLTLGMVLRGRSNSPDWLIYLTHGLGLMAIASWINWRMPNASGDTWAVLLLIGMAMEWGFSAGQSHRVWRRSAWYAGLLLAGLSYGVLWTETWIGSSDRGWFWLLTPISLTALASWRSNPRCQQATCFSTIALLLIQPLTFLLPVPRLVALGFSTGLMILNTRQFPSLRAGILTIGFGLAWVGAAIEYGAGDRLTGAWVLNLLALAPLLLWLLRKALRRLPHALHRIYAVATDGWAIALVGLTFLLLTLYNGLVPSEPEFATAGSISASMLVTAAIAVRVAPRPTNLGFWGLAWGIELLLASSLNQLGHPWETISLMGAGANLALALGTQWAGDGYVRQRQRPYVPSWHGIPLLYASLGLVLAHSSFTAATGLYTLAFALVGLGVGRRLPALRMLTYLGLFAMSGAAYELLIYQLLQAEGGQEGDGLVLLAGLGAGLAIAYRLLTGRLATYLRLHPDEVRAIAHIHWVMASGVLLLSLWPARSEWGDYGWIAVAVGLSLYALLEGRLQDQWTYVGIGFATITIGYVLDLIVPDSMLLRIWAGAIACPFALAMHLLPWSTWGWSLKPWQRSATALPGMILLLTFDAATIPVFLIVAALYAGLSRLREQVRLSYVSVALADWAILRWLGDVQVQEPLWYASILGLSLLYIAQVDPQMRSPSEREKRHWLRCLATGLIGLTAIYQSETSLLIALLTLGLAVALILGGLMLKMRAFLYVGTLTFMVQILRQLWLLIRLYPTFLWAVGILLGLAFIWIAATFETRRTQMGSLVQYWASELEVWD